MTASAAPDAGVPSHRSVRRAKWITLGAMVLLAGVAGVVTTAVSADESEAALLLGVPFFVGTLYWFALDARERNVPFRGYERVGMVLALGVFVPIRLVRTRGWRGLAWLPVMLAYGALVVAAAAAGELLTR